MSFKEFLDYISKICLVVHNDNSNQYIGLHKGIVFAIFNQWSYSLCFYEKDIHTKIYQRTYYSGNFKYYYLNEKRIDYFLSKFKKSIMDKSKDEKTWAIQDKINHINSIFK